MDSCYLEWGEMEILSLDTGTGISKSLPYKTFRKVD